MVFAVGSINLHRYGRITEVILRTFVKNSSQERDIELMLFPQGFSGIIILLKCKTYCILEKSILYSMCQNNMDILYECVEKFPYIISLYWVLRDTCYKCLCNNIRLHLCYKLSTWKILSDNLEVMMSEMTAWHDSLRLFTSFTSYLVFIPLYSCAVKLH